MEEIKRFRQAIDKICLNGVLENCKPNKRQFLSNQFLVPKPSGFFRFTLNLKKLNKFINTNNFQMEDIQMVVKLIFLGFFICMIDLEDAYYPAPIHKKAENS